MARTGDSSSPEYTTTSTTAGQAQVGARRRRYTETSGRELVRVRQLVDLKDQPIKMTRSEVGWSRVRSTASNCVCCCSSGSITLVTTDDSYLLDNIPLDNIQQAQANSSLQYLAMSNERKLAIVDLVEDPHGANQSRQSTSMGYSTRSKLSSTRSSGSSLGSGSSTARPGTPKVVNLSAHGLTMRDVLLWRWIDEFELALVTQDSLFTCSVNQTQISHPALSAIMRSPQLLTLARVCDVHPNLGTLCQISDVQRDHSTNLYAISALYANAPATPPPPTCEACAGQPAPEVQHKSSARLKRGLNSVPGRLSQLVHNEHFFVSLKSATHTSHDNPAVEQQPVISARQEPSREICGLVQVHCKLRNCSQLIPAQAVAFATCRATNHSCSSLQSDNFLEEELTTTLVAANRAEHRLRVHFIGMATSTSLTSNGQNASPSVKFHQLEADKFDFPTSIVCSRIGHDDRTHVAMITTKFGQLYICSVAYGTILCNVQISSDIISSTVLESRTRGLLAICRDGQILLVEIDGDKLSSALDQSRSLRPTSHDILYQSSNSTEEEADLVFMSHDNSQEAQSDISLEVLVSTKL